MRKRLEGFRSFLDCAGSDGMAVVAIPAATVVLLVFIEISRHPVLGALLDEWSLHCLPLLIIIAMTSAMLCLAFLYWRQSLWRRATMADIFISFMAVPTGIVVFLMIIWWQSNVYPMQAAEWLLAQIGDCWASVGAILALVGLAMFGWHRLYPPRWRQLMQTNPEFARHISPMHPGYGMVWMLWRRAGASWLWTVLFVLTGSFIVLSVARGGDWPMLIWLPLLYLLCVCGHNYRRILGLMRGG